MFEKRLGLLPLGVLMALPMLGLQVLSASQVAQAAAPRGLGLQGPLVQFIDTNVTSDHADISVQFACSVRYITNNPMNHGSSTRITLRLGPDCGTLLNMPVSELPIVGGAGELVTGARLDSVVPGEVTLELTWSRELDFVIAPTANQQGLRLRLLGLGKRKSSVKFTDAEAPEGYAVNLDSGFAPFDDAAVRAAAALLNTQAYVSETDIEEQHWFRLRVGPFASRVEAERVLKLAQAQYPRAWLALNDEDTSLAVVQRAGAASTLSALPSDPALPDAERATLLRTARDAMTKRLYPEAVEALTRLLRQPEYAGRAEAQELLGLVRERAGQLAMAKAEYEEYLRRYPDGPAAPRVRERLQSLIQASLTAKSVGDSTITADKRWTMAGSSAVTYQYGKAMTQTPTSSSSVTSLNSILVYGGLLLRDHGERYDFTTRIDAGYTHNLINSFGGSQDRTTAAYVEATDRHLGLTGRFGRQSLASIGVIGLFDGLSVGYQVNSKLTVSAAAGFPAYASYSALSSKQQFATVTAEYGPFKQAWVFDAYVIDEVAGGNTERRALGLQTRYSGQGHSAVLMADYDTVFQQFNSVTLIGNTRVPGNWLIGFDADHRRSPLLALSNALIGQTAPDLSALQLEFTPSQIRQLALDRTASSNTFVLSGSRALGDRWQFMADIATLQFGGTQASGGVAATTSTGLDKNLAVHLSGSSLLQSGDFNLFGLRFDDSPTSRSATVSWDARFRLPGAWRIGPRFSVEQLNDKTSGTKQMLYLPELRSDWTGRRAVFEVTTGYQMQSQTLQVQPGTLTGDVQNGSFNQRNYYVSAAYRFRF